MIKQPAKQLDIKPPLVGLRGDGQTFKYKGFVCPSCDGRGFFEHGLGYHGSIKGEMITSDCNRCGGLGRLCADVVIRWSPDEPLIEEEV